MNKIWNMINGIKGRSNTCTVKHLSVGNDIITDKAEIANTLAEQLAYSSSSDQCSNRNKNKKMKRRSLIFARLMTSTIIKIFPQTS